MKTAFFYYNTYKLIKNSYTLHQIEFCERLINKIDSLAARELASIALMRRCEIMGTIYQPETH